MIHFKTKCLTLVTDGNPTDKTSVKEKGDKDS